MSDLQDLIARNAVMAYNQGFERGAADKMAEIVELLESRLLMAKDEAYGLTAMRVSVDRQSAIAVTEALIYAIKGGQK